MNNLGWIEAAIPLVTVGEVRNGIRFTEESLKAIAASAHSEKMIGNMPVGSGINLNYNEQTRQLEFITLLYGEKL